jgi:hypothetical protein
VSESRHQQQRSHPQAGQLWAVRAGINSSTAIHKRGGSCVEPLGLGQVHCLDALILIGYSSSKLTRLGAGEITFPDVVKHQVLVRRLFGPRSAQSSHRLPME